MKIRAWVAACYVGEDVLCVAFIVIYRAHGVHVQVFQEKCSVWLEVLDRARAYGRATGTSWVITHMGGR